MKILFLTRKYPPIIGGMENFSFNLIKNYKKINKETFIIANTKGNKFLPIFLPISFLKAVLTLKKHKIETVHLGDGVLAPIGNLLKKLTGIKTAITIHGLDVTYNNAFYQKIIPKSIDKIDKIICVSEHTKQECIKRGINPRKIKVIPNGVNSEEFYLRDSQKRLRQKISNQFNISLENKKILFTAGRLVKRKGVEWFVRSVMPNLEKNFIYFVSGDGKERESIEEAIKETNLEERVFLLGKTDFNTLKVLYNSSDIFIMPNIQVEGDMEGFGIVALEAGSCGLPVIASNIEGIKDAVIDGKTGYLVEEKNAEEFINKINSCRFERNKMRKEVKNNFSWSKIAKEYLEVLG